MKQFYLMFLLLLILCGCQEDLTPSWLAVNEVTFNTTVTVEGENTHDIADAWVYIDNKEMGVWEIPFRMPVLEEGEHTLLIIPGIKVSGTSDIRTTNIFYKTYSTTINLEKEKTTTVVPTFSYKSAAKFIALEDFEDTGIILNPKNSEDSTKFNIISKSEFPDIVKYGNNCGKLELSILDSVAKVITDLNLPVVQNRMYLELDYLATNSFTIGTIKESNSGVQTDQGVFAGAYKTKGDKFEWKKIYFPLADRVNLAPFTSLFEFYIFSKFDNEEEEIGEIYIDNIKIVYFE